MLPVLDKWVTYLYFSGFRSQTDCSVILCALLCPLVSQLLSSFSLKTMIMVVPCPLLEYHPPSVPSWSSSDSLCYLVKYSRVSFIRPCQFTIISNLLFLTLVRALIHLSLMFIVLAIWPHLSWLAKLKQKRHLNTPVFPIPKHRSVFSLGFVQYFLCLAM